MNTMMLTMEAAEQSLAQLIRRMREHRESVVIRDAEGPLAYLTLALRREDCKDGTDPAEQTDPSAEFQQPGTGPRVSYCKGTGIPVVNGRPGQRFVTSEEIYEELGKTFP